MMFYVMMIFIYIFHMPKKEAEELRSISKQDVVEWYKMYFQ